jgi:hypothetical protein
MSEVTITMPKELTGEMLRAVREHPLTKVEDRDEMNLRIGWLICAWDVLAEHRRPPPVPYRPPQPTPLGAIPNDPRVKWSWK